LKKKKILYIGNFSFPNGNASGSRVLGNGYIFRELGYEVVYIGLDNNLSQESELSETLNEYDSFKFYNLPYPNGVRGWLLYKKRYLEVKGVLKKNDFNTVILYGSPTISFFAKRLKTYCKLNNITFIVDVVDWLTVNHGGVIYRIVKYLDVNYLKRYIANDADGVISISSYLKQYYEKKVKNTIIIPPVKDPNYFKIPSIINNKKFIKLIYIGNPFPSLTKNLKSNYYKDRLDLVIDNLYYLEHIEYIFDIYGITLEEYLFVVQRHKKILEILKSKIIFHGKINNIEAKNKISQADFLILFRNVNKMTSAGFPTKVSESISCGTPVITNSTSDLENYIINGKNGFLVNLFSKSLTTQLSNILSLPSSEIHEMKLYCYNSNLFSHKNYIDVTREFLTKLKIK
jgi:glycosyltransferase involved in cell wall biosynthesis